MCATDSLSLKRKNQEEGTLQTSSVDGLEESRQSKFACAADIVVAADVVKSDAATDPKRRNAETDGNALDVATDAEALDASADAEERNAVTGAGGDSAATGKVNAGDNEPVEVGS
jgi:hypothetical protein